MPPLRWPAKDPADILDYQLDISPALAGNDGDSISTLDVLISPTGPGDLSLENSTADGARAVLWLGAGNAGTTYNVTVIIGTLTGRSLARSVLLSVVTLTAQSADNLPLTLEDGTSLVDADGNALILGFGTT